MYSLINIESSDCAPRWHRIKDALDPRLAEIKNKLQALWESCEPYADKNFPREFARGTHQRF